MPLDPAVYPFCAVVGQERAKRALLLHAVHPRLKGVLLSGAAGTAKTTLVRGMAGLLPERRRVVVPLHVTEDRLLGGTDAAYAMRRGELRLAPGLLAEADGQTIAIDEANRMPERLLKAVLQAAEDGCFIVEREGVSAWRPSRFLLFGTTNPGEGELAPALLDRWGLRVRVETAADAAERAEIVRRRLAFERDPAGFVGRFETASAQLRENVLRAQRGLALVTVDEAMLRLAAEIAGEAGCAGHRADILLAETARAAAAWAGLSEVRAEHVREAAEFVLPHRMRAAAANPDVSSGERGGREQRAQEDGERRERRTDRDGEAGSPPQARQPELAGSEAEAERETGSVREAETRPPLGAGGVPERGQAGQTPNRSGDPGADAGEPAAPPPSASADAARAIVEAVGRDFALRRIDFAPPRALPDARAGKRNKAGRAGTRSGRYVRAAAPRGPLGDLALDATLRAAAPFQRVRRERQPHDEGGAQTVPRVLIERSDLREKVRESRTGTALLFVVDASGSMNAAKRMKAVKGAVLSLLRDAYRHRDSVGLIAFRDSGAELLLDMTRSVELAERKLRTMPVGGRTPLSAGLLKGAETIRSLSRQKSGLVPALVVVTDGKANVGADPQLDPWRESRDIARRIAEAGIPALVIDPEQGFVRLGFARRLADDLQAQYFRLEELEAGRIERAVRTLL